MKIKGKRLSTFLIIFIMILEAGYALSGDVETIYKTGMSAVTSFGVSSPNYNYEEYVCVYGDDGLDLKIQAQGRKGVNNSYKFISGTKLEVDHGEIDKKSFNESGYTFVRIKLSGLGHGLGRITAK